MFSSRVVKLLETPATVTCFFHPVTGKSPLLNLCQQTLHASLCLIIYHEWTTRHIAVLRGVRDGIAHLRNATFIKQIHNQFHLMETLEIGHLGRITSFSQCFEACFD